MESKTRPTLEALILSSNVSMRVIPQPQNKVSNVPHSFMEPVMDQVDVGGNMAHVLAMLILPAGTFTT
jgi:hypothetical protein